MREPGLESVDSTPHADAEPVVIGEVFTAPLERTTARHVNGRVRGQHEDIQISLGELGDHSARDVRFRDSLKQGFLTAYVRTREFSEDHTVVTKITISTIALGSVLAAVAALRYNKKS